MLIRIAEFSTKPKFHEDVELLGRFRAWMREQPGFRNDWHAIDARPAAPSRSVSKLMTVSNAATNIGLTTLSRS
jgi:hypothetical protein